MAPIPALRRYAARRPWLAATVAVATLGAVGTPLALGGAAFGAGGSGATSASAAVTAKGGALRLTTDQIRALSTRYAVGVDQSGTAAQRFAQAQAAAAAAKTGRPTDPTQGLTTARSSSSGATGAAAAGQTTAGSGVSFHLDTEVETARGLGLTAAIPGSADWFHIDTSGQVARVGADGRPLWTKTEQGLVADWGMKGSVWYLPVPPKLSMYAGFNPISGASVSSDQTYAVGDFGGGSGHDIAVAYIMGDGPSFPFTLPDSKLTHMASFVTVIDGRTGKTLWHKAYPGVVSRIADTGHGLAIANDTGPNWYREPVAEQADSRSNISLVTFRHAGQGTVTATTAWTHSIDVPWAAWTALTPTADGVAAAWSDTPMGLGSPRPADGHVIMLDGKTGAVRFDTPTPGFPRILRDDPARHRLVAAEDNDPADAVSWQLAAFDPASGARSVLASRSGAMVTSLRVADADPRNPAYVATELALSITPDDRIDATGSNVVSFDAAGRSGWSTAIPAAFSGDLPVVGGMFLPDAHRDTVVVTTQDPRPDTAAVPDGPEGTQILSFDARTGRLRWSHSGAVGTGLEPAQYADTILSVAADQTAYAYKISDGKAVAEQPQLGDMYAGVLVDSGNPDGVKNLVVGGQSRGVFLLDGHHQPNGAPKVLWNAPVQGEVHQILLVDGGQKVFVAATGGWDLIDVKSGKVKLAKDLPGAITWTGSTVGTGKNTQIVVPADALTAYDLDGKQLWTFKPAGSAVKFSNAAIDADGRVIAEYGTAAGDTAPKYGAVAVDGKTGKVLWDQAADASVVGADFLGGAYASPDIPVADGRGVALAWAAKTANVWGTTLVEVRDARTGAVLTTHTDGGSTTQIGFDARPGLGLAQFHFAQISRLMPDGVTWTDTGTYSDDYSGAFATTSGGSTVVVQSPFGVEALDPAVLDGQHDYPSGLAGTDPIDDAHQIAVQGSKVLGFQQDMRLWDLNRQWNGGGYYDPDVNIHGVTVESLDGKLVASTPPATTATTATTAPQNKLGAAPKQDATPAFAWGDPVSGNGWGDGSMHPHSVFVDPDAPGDPNASSTAGSGKLTAVLPPNRGYTPAQIQHHLALTGDGAGQTVAIVDAFHHPKIADDLATFDKQFGLPDADLSVLTMPGTTVDGGGWDGETALDVEWVHAVAPKAKIVLVEAVSPQSQYLYEAVDAAAKLHPAAVSMSWGMNGEFSGESFYDHHCVLADSVCVESSGDSGYKTGYSATSPTVLSIGGTTLKLDAVGNTLSETAWRGTGGGLSYFEKRPAFQDAVNPSAFRGTPDVSAVADPVTGVQVYYSDVVTGRSGWLRVGGTSLSAPIWSAILAAADAERAAAGKAPLASGDGSVFRAVYGLGGALSDVTAGSNGPCPVSECTAHAGYDTVTGLGTPGPGVDAVLAQK